MTPDRRTCAAELLARRQARRHLSGFTAYTHHNWIMGEHHKAICSKLEQVERGEIRNLAIFAPPRHSKSELASKRFPAWYLGRNPHRQIITCTYNAQFAADFGAEVRQIVRSPEFQNVFPGVQITADRRAASRWTTNNGGFYVSSSVGGPITGYGADVLLIDDPIKNRADADSRRKREAVWAWYSSTAITRLQPGGSVVMMLTRWHEDDLAGRALQKGDWEVLKLPAIKNEGRENERALFPEWFDLESLKHKRDHELSARDWSALYQQEPRAEQGSYMRREWFSERYDDAPRDLSVYMASDFAVTEFVEDTDPDHTEHGVFGVSPDGDLWVLDWWNGQTTSEVWIEELLRLAKKWKPLAWFGEGGVIRRAIEPFLVRRQRETKVYFRKEWINPINDKQTRGRAFQARASMGTVHFPRDRWADRILDQVIGFPGADHDDAFDVLSLMCGAIDQAHPALETKETEPKFKSYRRRREPEINWKVV